MVFEVPILEFLYFRDMPIDFALQILSHYLEKSWMWLLVVTQYHMYNVGLRLHNWRTAIILFTYMHIYMKSLNTLVEHIS